MHVIFPDISDGSPLSQVEVRWVTPVKKTNVDQCMVDKGRPVKFQDVLFTSKNGPQVLLSASWVGQRAPKFQDPEYHTSFLDAYKLAAVFFFWKPSVYK